MYYLRQRTNVSGPFTAEQIKGMLRELVLSFIPADRRGRATGAAIDDQTMKQESVLRFLGSGLSVDPSRTGMLIGVSFIYMVLFRFITRDILSSGGRSLPLAFGRFTSTPCCNSGAVTMKITSSTSMTSTNGVTLISERTALFLVVFIQSSW